MGPGLSSRVSRALPRECDCCYGAVPRGGSRTGCPSTCPPGVLRGQAAFVPNGPGPFSRALGTADVATCAGSCCRSVSHASTELLCSVLMPRGGLITAAAVLHAKTINKHTVPNLRWRVEAVGIPAGRSSSIPSEILAVLP